MLSLTTISTESIRIPLRRPFRFGVVELNELHHLLVRAQFTLDGNETEGIAGENLAPKWFSKNPQTTLDQDIAELRSAFDAVAQIAQSLPPAASVFDFWLELYRRAAASLPQFPPLVRQLGVSLLERCAIDAFCRRAGRPFHSVLRDGLFGIDPSKVHPQLDWPTTLAALPAAPLESIAVRHTVGLADRIDALPASIGSTGINRLKIKLSGNPAADIERLIAIEAMSPECRIERITLDGNENYRTPAALETFLRDFREDSHLPRTRAALVWIEQPLHRDIALSDDIAPLLRAFEEFPHGLDESDDSLDSVPRALRLGYAGTTHKNCKGVFKSILAAAVLREHSKRTNRKTILSGEDLTIVAPWSQVQDLAVAAAVGVVDVERNGHHYADGLSAFAPSVADAAEQKFLSLYARDDRGVVSLQIVDGRLRLPEVNGRAFGGV